MISPIKQNILLAISFGVFSDSHSGQNLYSLALEKLINLYMDEEPSDQATLAQSQVIELSNKTPALFNLEPLSEGQLRKISTQSFDALRTEEWFTQLTALFKSMSIDNKETKLLLHLAHADSINALSKLYGDGNFDKHIEEEPVHGLLLVVVSELPLVSINLFDEKNIEIIKDHETMYENHPEFFNLFKISGAKFNSESMLSIAQDVKASCEEKMENFFSFYSDWRNIPDDFVEPPFFDKSYFDNMILKGNPTQQFCSVKKGQVVLGDENTTETVTKTAFFVDFDLVSFIHEKLI